MNFKHLPLPYKSIINLDLITYVGIYKVKEEVEVKFYFIGGESTTYRFYSLVWDKFVKDNLIKTEEKDNLQ